jgi:hypothetical protein
MPVLLRTIFQQLLLRILSQSDQDSGVTHDNTQQAVSQRQSVHTGMDSATTR